MFTIRSRTSRCAVELAIPCLALLLQTPESNTVHPNVNKPRYSRRAAAALILSPDPLGGALIGAAVELSGFRAEFPHANEPLRSALSRLKATHILIDCDDPTSQDESALGPALMTGARLFLFGTVSKAEALRAVAARYQMRLIVLPRDIDRLQEILTRRPSPIRELSSR